MSMSVAGSDAAPTAGADVSTWMILNPRPMQWTLREDEVQKTMALLSDEDRTPHSAPASTIRLTVALTEAEGENYVVRGTALGRGGYSKVYGGLSFSHPNNICAVKVFLGSMDYETLDEEDVVESMSGVPTGKREPAALRELRILRILHFLQLRSAEGGHPHVLKIYGCIRGDQFLKPSHEVANVLYSRPALCPKVRAPLFAFIKGGSLHEVVKAFPDHLTAWIVLRWFIQTLKGLNYLHTNRILHRDMKAANLLVQMPPESDGGTPTERMMRSNIVVADFSEATMMEPVDQCSSPRVDGVTGSTTGFRTVIGTPGFCAPEIIDFFFQTEKRGNDVRMVHRCRYGAAAELWSAATVFYLIIVRGYPATKSGLPALHRIYVNHQLWPVAELTSAQILCSCRYPTLESLMDKNSVPLEATSNSVLFLDEMRERVQACPLPLGIIRQIDLLMAPKPADRPRLQSVLDTCCAVAAEVGIDV